MGGHSNSGEFRYPRRENDALGFYLPTRRAQEEASVNNRIGILVMAAALAGCDGTKTTANLLQSITLAPNQTAALGTPLKFVLGGAGKCGTVGIDWGAFPGFREFSLILRLTPQVVQGGTGTATFTAGQAGTLELCQNDGDLSDNKGGWQIEISGDELGSTPAP